MVGFINAASPHFFEMRQFQLWRLFQCAIPIAICRGADSFAEWYGSTKEKLSVTIFQGVEGGV